MRVEPGDRDAPHPLVSVVIPSFNSAATIAQSIESVLFQSVSDIELIVCDDDSTDATVEIVESFSRKDPRVRISRAAENFGGPAAPRNRGIKLARGKWLAFLDSDDLWMQNKLEAQLMVASETGADFISTGSQDFSGSIGNQVLMDFPLLVGWDPVFEELTYKKLLFKSMITISTVLINSKVLRENRLKFAEKKNLVAVEDYELWLRVLSLPSIKAVKIKEPLIFYRKAETSLSKNKLQMFLRVRAVLLGELKNRSPIIRELLVTYLLCHYVIRSIYFRRVLKRL